jgi:hypothetical protein
VIGAVAALADAAIEATAVPAAVAIRA